MNSYCKKCGQEYGKTFFLSVASRRNMERIRRFAPTDYVCAHCTIDALAEAGITFGYMSTDTNVIKKSSHSTLILPEFELL